MTDEQIRNVFRDKQMEVTDLLNSSNLLNAEHTLNDLERIFSTRELSERPELAAELKVEFQKLQSLLARGLLGKVNALLKEKLDDEKIQEALKLLDDAQKLVGEKPDIENLRVRVSNASNFYRSQKTLEETRRACEALWLQEQALIKQKVAPQRILDDIFAKALSLARAASEEFPKSLALDGLKNDAELRYQMARKRYEIKTTADQTSAYREAFEKLDAIEDKESLIPWNDASGQQLEPISVREAILQILNLAGGYAHKKAQEYLQAAQADLESHAPRLAREQVEKRKDLWELHAEDNAILQKYLDEKIRPEMEKLEKAESLLAQANITSSILQGWTLTDEAVKSYPWVAGLEDTRGKLTGRSLHQAGSVLEQAAGFLTAFRSEANNAALDEAGTRMAEAHNVLELVNQHLEQVANPGHQARALECSRKEQELMQTIASARKFLEEVNAEIIKLENLFASDPSQAQAVWNGLISTYNGPYYVEQYGDLLKRFPRLDALRSRIEAFRDFEAGLQTLEDAFDSNDLEIIRHALETAGSILKDTQDLTRRERVKMVMTKLQGRREFLEGRQALDAGDMEEALKRLNKAASHAAHPDRQAVNDLISHLEGERENEKKIGDALESATSLLEDRPRRAYEILKNVVGLPTRQKKDMTIALEGARQVWERQLVSRLVKLREDKPADPKAIRVLAHEILEALPEPHAEETMLQARKALAHAFALEARVHAAAGHWENAEVSWKGALENDAINSEYEQGWRAARLRRARAELERAGGAEEVQGILADLQSELMEDPGLFELQAEYTYRLAQNPTLGAAERLAHLNQARNAVRVAGGTQGISDALKGRLEDLNNKIGADEKLLKSQIEIEKRMSSDASLAQLLNAVQEKNKLMETQNISAQAREGLQTWWDTLTPRVVKTLETKDDGLSDERPWERFEVRSKIALLDPDNPHAQMLVRAVPRQVDTLLDEINAAMSDRLGLDWQERDAARALKAQQEHLFGLRERAQMLHEMVERLSRQLGGQAERQKRDIQEAVAKLQTWIRQFEAFRQNTSRLREFLSQARQDDDWSDFDQVLRGINEDGFGSHRAVRMMLEERDQIRDKRQQLKALHDSIVSAAQEPQGLRFADAIHLLDVLETDERQGDPDDIFGFQVELQINDPLVHQSVRQAREVRKWLETRQAQTELVTNWLQECGLADLVPAELHISGSTGVTKKILPWDEARVRLEKNLDRGDFTGVLAALDAILSETAPTLAGSSKPMTRRGDANVETTPRSYKGFIRLQEAHERIAQPPLPADRALSRLVNSLLQQASERLSTVEDNIEALGQVRKATLEKQKAWKNAELELEQALNELRDARNRRNPLGKDTAIQAARTRANAAVLACRAIASRHPLLEDIERQLA